MNAQMKPIRETSDNTEGENLPDPLRSAYEAAVRFEPSGLAETVLSSTTLRHMAAEEAAIDSIHVAVDGISPGLRGLMQQASMPLLSSWMMKRAPFDVAIQSYMDGINAARNAEVRRAEIERKATEAETAVIAEAQAHQPYTDSRREKEQADLHFQQLHQGEGGRTINTFANTWWYYLLIIGTTSVEWLINYDALFAWLGIPFLAAGGTIIMAWAVGTASHVHGAYLKQWTSRFAPHTVGKGRYAAVLVAATALLLVVIGVAGWARYSFALHGLSTQGPVIQTDQVVAQSSPISDVLVSLGFNLLIWLVGLVIAFLAHDESHELQEADLDRWRKTREFNRLHRPWEKRIQLGKALATRELGQLSAATSLALAATKPQRDMLEQVGKREEFIYRAIASQIQPLADLYRMALGNNLNERGHFIYVGGQRYTGQQYKQLPVNIDARLLQKLLA